MPPKSKRRFRSSPSLASPSTSPDASATPTPTPSPSPAASPPRQVYSPSVTPRPPLPDDTCTRAADAIATSLVDWAIVEVAAEVHHQRYLRSPDCPLVAREAQGAGAAGEIAESSASAALALTGGKGVAAAAAVGKNQSGSGTAMREMVVPSAVLYSDKNVNVECSNCSSSTAASRYAQHLEKCLGRGGRTSSRAASARLKASAEKAEKEAAADLSGDVIPRKRHASSLSVKPEEMACGDLPPLPLTSRHRAS